MRHHLPNLKQGMRFIAAQIENGAPLDVSVTGRRARTCQRGDDIINVQTIAKLLPIAEHAQRLAA